MWFANQAQPDIANEMRAAARYANTPREAHRRTNIGIIEYVSLREILGLHLRGAVDMSWLILYYVRGGLFLF